MGVKRFSERIVAAPFGRYQAGDEVEPPANRVLVGREGQRAFFIDLLLRMGRRGAFLVTGRRGVGKTSFVHHCISEYRNEVYKRFLHSNVGRVTFWDRAGILILMLTAILVALIVSELTEVLMLPAQRSILVWLIVAPLALICLYPMLYAREVMEALVEARQTRLAGLAFHIAVWIRNHLDLRQRPLFGLRDRLLKPLWKTVRRASETERLHRMDAAPATVLTLITAVLTWCIAPFGAAALSMSRLFLGLCTFYLWVQSTSFNRGQNPKRRQVVWMLWTVGLIIVMAVAVAGVGHGQLPPQLLVGSPGREFKGNLLVAMALLGGGFFLRGLHLWKSFRPPEIRGYDQLGPTRSPQIWYHGFGLILIVASLSWLLIEDLRPSLGFAVILLTGAFILYKAFGRTREGDTSPSTFHPQPLFLLAAKAFICIVVALHLIHPIIARMRWPDFSVGSAKPPHVETSELRAPVALRSLAGADTSEASAVFHGRNEEMRWIFALFLTLLTIYVLEYEWIIRPFAPEREEPSINSRHVQPDWRDQQIEEHSSLRRRSYNEIAQLTLPWILYRTWLPILVVSVNLGFEKLDHRRVVHAMLAGLRDRFSRAFLTWNSGLANLGRGLSFLIMLLLVTLAGEKWFDLPALQSQEDEKWLSQQARVDYANICDGFVGRQKGSGIVNVVCKLKWSNSVFHILYFDLFSNLTTPPGDEQDRHLLFYVIPYQTQAWPKEELRSVDGQVYPALLEKGIHFRLYHLILLLLFYILGRWILHRLPAIPYREIVNRIDDVMDNLAARTSVTSTTGRWKPAQWLQGFFVDERVRQTEQDPVDPRTVEFVFLQILRDIQNTAILLPAGRNQLVSLPTPEIIFIFDELDKLGTRLDPEEGASASPQQAEILHAERRRSMELHKLLADMKNLLSSAPARFIFVGGRNLHDEWLADQTARQPLLTNIFNAEVYLPSLLTDFEGSARKKLHQQIEAYLRHQVRRAEALYRRALKKRSLPSLGLPLHMYEGETYVETEPRSGAPALRGEACGNSLLDVLPVREFPAEDADDLEDIEYPGAIELRRDLVQFLTYRSMGNPKRLRELLGTFIRPVGRVVGENTYHKLKAFQFCDHVLRFGDSERFRIQLLARIYRHLALTFELRLVQRDDKLAVSVFYLTDFLFKFHRRAFSWSNLERVDELVHIHRAPDLREVLEAIVIHWSDRFLHRIRNGMYDFRFRSDLAREVEYISRQSHEEMAAFNFTLDESQALKSVYETDINRFKGENAREVQDLLAGLGELHEFDQEYETARFYYRRAAASLDTELKDLMGGSQVFEPASPAIEIIGGAPPGREHARLFMTWGIARLRLMLQVGMTFEIARNLERAEVEYRNARTLARSLLLAMLDGEGRTTALTMGLIEDRPEDADDRLHALKHLNLIYQPVFAEAWVAEKLSGGVDTSIALVEKELWQLRNLLPFVRDSRVVLSMNPSNVRGSNFALIASELHNKAGDLYFFKGRQATKIRHEKGLDHFFTDAGKPEGPQRGHEGYLLRAHYHYAVGLHELRRFITHRRCSSKYKFNLWSSKAHKHPWNTIDPGGWTDFIYRSAGGTFNDIAEVMLGRVSLFSLLREIRTLGESQKPLFKTVAEGLDEFALGCNSWLERAPVADEQATDPSPAEPELEEVRKEDNAYDFQLPDFREREFKILFSRGGLELDCGTLGGWLGLWNVADLQPKQDNWRLLLFEESTPHTNPARLVLALNLTLAGASYLEKGGYLEDAAREHLKICETVHHYLWWVRAVQSLKGHLPAAAQEWVPQISVCHLAPSAPDGVDGRNLKGAAAYWFYLMEVALHALQQADKLFRRSRREDQSEKAAYIVGDKVPTAALTMACSLGLAMEDWPQKALILPELKALLKSWTGEDAGSFRKILEQSLVRHSYPMIHRLHGLKVLIDDAVVSGKSEAEGDIFNRTIELLELSANLNAPLHFTPLQLGTTCALVYLRYRKENLDEKGRDSLDRISAAARRELSDSEEMYSLRRAYYENIADLYYLYDDFNDRQVHFNHAIQMAGTELSGLLRYLLDHPEAEERPSPASSAPSRKR